MKTLGALLLLFLTIAAVAQTPNPQAEAQKRQVIQQYCRGSEVTSGPEFAIFQGAVQKLGQAIANDRQHTTYITMVDNKEINAWAVNFNMSQSLICVPSAMVQFMGDAEGELAFIIAHEIGHTVDDVCKTEQGRLAVANSRGSLGALFGGILGGEKGAASASRISQQRGCEARADEIGFQIFTSAGYSPFAAAGAFGRLEMYLGDTSTSLLARLASLGSDHPMTPDRIRHMRNLLVNYSAQHLAAGQ